MQKINISLYTSAKDNAGSIVPFSDVLALISSNKLQKSIKKLRTAVEERHQLEKLDYSTDADRAEALKIKDAEISKIKTSLPAVTWSGSFSQRKGDCIVSYSQLICIDFDKVKGLQKMFALLLADPYTHIAFISPSGTGIKVIVAITGTLADHLATFLALETYYKKTYGLEADKSGKDTTRLCFLTYDAELHHNENSQRFVSPTKPDTDEPTPTEIKHTRLTTAQTKELHSAQNDFDWIAKFTDNKVTYADGSRNLWCFTFASNCCRKGINQLEALSEVLHRCPGLETEEINTTVAKAYKYNNADFGKYKYNPSNNGATNQRRGDHGSNPFSAGTGGSHPNVSGAGNHTALQGDQGSDEIKFYTQRKVTKNAGKGEEGGEYSYTATELNRRLFIKFLQQRGYFIYETDREGYQICHNAGGIIRPVKARHIKTDIYQWCEERELYEVDEMLRRGEAKIFADTSLESMKVHRPDFVADNWNEAFFYFKNCNVKVTADAVTPISRIVDKNIWDTQVIDHVFEYEAPHLPLNDAGYYDIEKFNCDIAKFIVQTSCNPKTYDTIAPEIAHQRFKAFCTSIGYMLHSYKPKIGKAIISIDHKIPADKSEQNGRTGKSLIGKSFKYLKGTTELDGREFDEKYQFRFEKVGVDTKIIVMADCKHNLDFGTFFNPITSDFTFNRRHAGYVTMPYDESPKWWFDTNFIFKGDGGSYRGRQHIIEFDDFYSAEYTPVDYFGYELFSKKDWDQQQWNRFFNFYLYCVQLYLANGLVEYPHGNHDSRKLLVESNTEFLDWMDSRLSLDVLDQENIGQYYIRVNHEFKKKELLQAWNNEAQSLSLIKTTPHALARWVPKYCQHKGYQFASRKSNGIEYYLIKDADYKDPKAAAAPTQLTISHEMNIPGPNAF